MQWWLRVSISNVVQRKHPPKMFTCPNNEIWLILNSKLLNIMLETEDKPGKLIDTMCLNAELTRAAGESKIFS